ncbi:MAG: TRAP transporter substrate-binding protein [Syntrophorhabdales bacterium]|jgi:TRAP-type C4-dicarboxylate transport system substrate-binding protein
MQRKLFFLMFVLAVFLSVSSVASATVIKLKLANYFPTTHMNSLMLGKYCEELNKKLAGKVEITQYTGGTLLSAPKMAAGVSTGIADIGFSHCSYTRGRFPVMEIMELPLGFPSPWIGGHVANDFYNKFKPKEWDGFHTIVFCTSPVNVVQTLTKPVRTLEDIRGLKLRGTGRIGDIAKALGAVPMPIEIVDTYEALRRGVVEGNFGPLEQLKGFKIGEIEKYVTASWKIGSVFSFYLVMNKNKWNSLPPDVQKVITDYSRDFLDRWLYEWNAIDIEGREFFVKQGGQILPLSDTESARWVKAAEPVIAGYKKDMVAKGFKAQDVDGWISFIRQRIEYWTGQEKAKKIPTAYQY